MSIMVSHSGFRFRYMFWIGISGINIVVYISFIFMNSILLEQEDLYPRLIKGAVIQP